MYQLVQSPNEILRTPAKTVDFSGPRLQKIIDEMTQTLLTQKDPEGVGLAANQVGLPYKIFLARFDPKSKPSRSQFGRRSSNKDLSNWQVYTFINPEILEHSEELQPTGKDKNPQLEGCLSRPQYYGVVKRWKSVKVRYQQLATSSRSEKQLMTEEKIFEGFPAVIIQHELDHLSGKVFIERILEQKGKLYKIVGKDKNGKEKWEEVEL